SVRFMIRDYLEFFVGTSPDHREESCCSLLILFRESVHPGAEFIFGHIIGIKACLWWFFLRDPVYERLILFIARPRAFVNHKIVQSLAALLACVCFKFFLECIITAPSLAKK